MSGRQRLLNVLNRRQVDRIPIVPFIHVNFVKAFLGRHDIDPVTDTIQVYDHFGFDIIHRNCTPAYDDIRREGERWRFDDSVIQDGRDETTTTVIHTGTRDLRQVHRLTWVVQYDAEASPTEYLIKSEEDFDAILAGQPPVGTIDVSPIPRAQRLLGERGITAPWVHGVFNHVAYYYRKIDDLLIDAMTDPAFYRRMMEYFLDRNISIISQFIDAGANMLSYAGNIASGKMVGASFFREHVLPYEKRLIDYVQSRGVHVLYHNCGYARNLFPCYRELGLRVYESLTPPPQGDTVLEEAFEKLGPEITLHGGIDQIRFLMTASPAEVRTRVHELLDAGGKRGNFILGTSDYLHEATPHENIVAIAEAGRAFAGQ